MSKKRVFVVIITLLLLLSLGITVFASIDAEEKMFNFNEMIPSDIQLRMKKQEKTLQIYYSLIELFEKDEYGVVVYPDYYAGEFINDDDCLVVLLTTDFSNEQILEYLQDTSTIYLQTVDYSYNDLLERRNLANNLISQGIHIISDGIDVQNNRYNITVLTEDYERAKILINDPCVELEASEKLLAMTSFTNGDRIYNEDTGAGIAIGMCGTYNGYNAILTCGHGNDNSTTLFGRYPYIMDKLQSHRIGQVVFQQANIDPNNYGSDSLGDYAIIKVTSSDTITNHIWPSGTITSYCTNAPSGTLVFIYGPQAGYAWGTVTSVGLRITYYDALGCSYTVGALTSVSVQNFSGTAAVQPGDSGAPIWRSISGSNSIYGIVTAGNSAGNTMYVTPFYCAYYKGFQPKLN